MIELKPAEALKLINLAKNGDLKAFDEIYRHFFTPVYRYVFLRVQDKTLAEDISQIVFLKVYKALGSFKPSGSSPLAYFFTVARNALIDHFRTQKPPTLEITEDIADTTADFGNTPQNALMKLESSEKLYKAINLLSEEQREVIIQKFINGFSAQELAKLLNKTEGAVRQIQCRALKALKKILT